MHSFPSHPSLTPSNRSNHLSLPPTPSLVDLIVQELMVMEGQKTVDSSRWRRGSQGRKRSSTHDAQRLPQDMIGDPWPVTKPSGRKDTVFEAAQVLVRARNAVVVNECSNAITLLPASGSVPGFQGGSCDTPLYSLRSPRLEPFRVHIWQNPCGASMEQNNAVVGRYSRKDHGTPRTEVSTAHPSS